ncbi:uncharacterized protein LOC117172306 [Belonocnema kinseyi]|uniref:uncharacterized protein LOC117172306 n=1 Tax=Belonocnema kinseyi TaxID=2817044 RepID=UPI00143DCA3B|nr:uncharacterized protein LOC117172306 [Belonocnema kinseyi]
MPPTPRSAKAALEVDQRKLADLVKSNSDLSIRGQKKVWEKIADELKAPVEDVKKAWSKFQEQEAAKKIKESNMRRSLRSSTLDTSKGLQKPAEFCRRSLRSSSIDKSSVTGPSNDNSCASSTCSSPPKAEEKRSVRSISQLSSILETDLISMAAGDATFIGLEELKGPHQDLDQDQDQDQDQDETLISIQESMFSEQYVSDTNDRFQQDSGTERNLRHRFSEPGHPTSKKMIQTSVNSSPRRGSINNNKNNKNKRSPNPTDSTRSFFDSMALTVATFPQHLQAQVKGQVCKIISDTEYDFSLPQVP